MDETELLQSIIEQNEQDGTLIPDCGDTAELVNIFDSSIMQSAINKGKSIPPIHRLWGDFWWENELVFLFADSGIGKSILATQIAYEICIGESDCMEVGTEPQSVLYFDFELSERQLARRYNKAVFPTNMIRCTLSNNADSSDLSFGMLESIKEMLIDTKAKVMILDNLSYLSTQTAEAEYAGIIMEGLTRIKRELNVSIMVIAHTPKIEENKFLTKTNMAGSKLLSNFADGVFAIGRTKNGGRYLKLLKTRMVSEPDENSLLPYFNIVPNPYLHFEKVGEETEKKLLYGKPAKDFFSSLWNCDTTKPIPLVELVKLVMSADKTKGTDKSKNSKARKRIDRAINNGILTKDEMKNIYLNPKKII